MDPLNHLLAEMRLSSTLISRAHLSAPWAVATDGASGVIVHAVVTGGGLVQVDGEADLALDAGATVALSRGQPHVLCSARHVRPVPVGQVPKRALDGGSPTLVYGGGGPETRIICGHFQLAHPAADSLLSLLPPVLHLPPGPSGLAAWFDTSLRMVLAEEGDGRPGTQAAVTRLLDLVFVQVLRTSVRDIAERSPGLIKALGDPPIARALALVHARPAEPWTGAALAGRVGLSRSAFFARFSAVLGVPPAGYLQRWRVQKAASLLEQSELGTGELADRVGYRSEDAFRRAFRKHMGVSPVAWRRDRAARSA